MNHTSTTSKSKLARKSQQQNRIRSTALRWLDLGASPIPVRTDGSKAPVGKWKGFQAEPASIGQIDGWFGSSQGLGLVTGYGGIELLEFETEAAWVQWCRLMVAADRADDLRKVCDGYLARSGGGGYHLLYRTPEPEGNQVLAGVDEGRDVAQYVQVDGTVKTTRVLVETRGVGGYVIVAGGNRGVHPTGRPYRRIRMPEYLLEECLPNWTFTEDQGVKILDKARAQRSAERRRDRVELSPAPDLVCDVSTELREDMFACARQLDRRTPTADKTRASSRTLAEDRQGQGVAGLRPGDAWAGVTTWDEILEPHGWRRDHSTDESDRWTRPGKSSGTSATTNYNGSQLLYVYTSSTDFEPETSYTKFGAYAVLNHDGDYEAAAAELVGKGFADPSRVEADTREELLAQMAHDAGMRIEANEMARQMLTQRAWRVPVTRSGLTALSEPAVEPPHLVEGLVIGEGVTLLSAQNKTGKSTVGLNLVRAVVYGEDLFEKLPTHFPDDACVGVLNAEVSTATYEKWCREHGLFADEDHAARVFFYHCVGDHVDIQVPVWREWMIGWLRENNVKLWVLDPFSKIFRGDENSATEVNAWWTALREIMAEADVPAAFVIHHAGHVTEGMRARARGSSALEGDPEVILSYEHNGKPGDFAPDDRRYIAGVGRIDVVDKLNLNFEHDTRRLVVDGESAGKVADRELRLDREVAKAAYTLLDELASAGKPEVLSQVAIKKAVVGNERATEAAISRCHARGWLHAEQATTGRKEWRITRGLVPAPVGGTVHLKPVKSDG